MPLEKYDITSYFVVSRNFFLFGPRKNRLIESSRYDGHWPVTFCKLGKIPEISTSSIHTLDSA